MPSMLPTPDLGFSEKHSICDIYQTIQPYLAIISQVHELGAVKYACFSFQNTPDTSNATVRDNLDAMFRHYTLMTTNQIYDPEGFPHIYFLLTRCHMFLTNWYREQLMHLDPNYKKLEKSDIRQICTYRAPVSEFAAGYLPIQISSEAQVSMLKWARANPNKFEFDPFFHLSRTEPSTEKDESMWALLVQDALYKVIAKVTSDWEPDAQELYSEILLPDLLFLYTMCYTKHVLNRRGLQVSDELFNAIIEAKQADVKPKAFQGLTIEGAQVMVPSSPGFSFIEEEPESPPDKAQKVVSDLIDQTRSDQAAANTAKTGRP